MRTFADAIAAVGAIRAKLLRIEEKSCEAQIKSDCELALDEVGPLSAFLREMQTKTKPE
jgi:hypothetical protein